MTQIVHPLAEGTMVEAQQPSCACKGATIRVLTGKILKVISNQSGTWYYLDNNNTVRATTVTRVIQ